ncbi:hypothetical protein H4R20_003128 [Coemansia guatemalensis]|uniref:RING-type domain-containing protein n=1 Tax=Coemansia guatemalensis TaxID=2761395 RepID=A0A9W8LU06_9FUNG|nr:hypothetical protein H4R20_003128 [Coemansia guatemalensis]
MDRRVDNLARRWPRNKMVLLDVASLVLCSLASGRFGRASPVPQDMTSEPLPESASSAPTESMGTMLPPSETDSEHQETGHIGSPNIYYILAIGACAIGVLALVAAFVYRRRYRRRRGTSPAAGAGEGGMYGLYSASSGEGHGHGAQPHHRQKKKHIVLSQKQFDMLPHTIAQGPLSSEATRDDANAANVTSTDQKGHEHLDDKTKVPISPGALAESEACSICLGDIVRGERLVRLMPCNHQFHSDCVNRWLTQKSTLCPLCKADVLEGLGLSRPKSIAEDNDNDIELVTIPLTPDRVLTAERADDAQASPAAQSPVPSSTVEMSTRDQTDPAVPPRALTVDHQNQQQQL